MQTFNQSLIELFKTGQVGLEDPKAPSSRPHHLELALKQAALQRLKQIRQVVLIWSTSAGFTF
jgi:Tfp pilus assembly ATPase PilU